MFKEIYNRCKIVFSSIVWPLLLSLHIRNHKKRETKKYGGLFFSCSGQNGVTKRDCPTIYGRSLVTCTRRVNDSVAPVSVQSWPTNQQKGKSIADSLFFIHHIFFVNSLSNYIKDTKEQNSNSANNIFFFFFISFFLQFLNNHFLLCTR